MGLLLGPMEMGDNMLCVGLCARARAHTHTPHMFGAYTCVCEYEKSESNRYERESACVCERACVCVSLCVLEN